MCGCTTDWLPQPKCLNLGVSDLRTPVVQLISTGSEFPEAAKPQRVSTDILGMCNTLVAIFGRAASVMLFFRGKRVLM